MKQGFDIISIGHFWLEVHDEIMFGGYEDEDDIAEDESADSPTDPPSEVPVGNAQ